MPPKFAPNAAMLQSIDRIVERRYPEARARALELARRPDLDTPDKVVAELVKRCTRELAAVGAMSGGAAAIPGAGTAGAAVASGIDATYTVGKLAELVMAIGVAHGHDEASFEERRTWVLTVLSLGRSAAVGLEGVAGRLGARGGSKLLSSMQRAGVGARTAPATANPVVAKLMTRFAAEQAAARLGRLLPFGIGAGIGVIGNAVIVRSVARSAAVYFAAEHPAGGQRPHPDAIEVSGRDVVPGATGSPSEPAAWSGTESAVDR